MVLLINTQLEKLIRFYLLIMNLAQSFFWVHLFDKLFVKHLLSSFFLASPCRLTNLSSGMKEPFWKALKSCEFFTGFLGYIKCEYENSDVTNFYWISKYRHILQIYLSCFKFREKWSLYETKLHQRTGYLRVPKYGCLGKEIHLLFAHFRSISRGFIVQEILNGTLHFLYSVFWCFEAKK